MGIRINALTETTSPNNTDNGVLDTSAGTRRITWSNIKTAIFGAINGLTSKSTPVGADVIAIGDSAASFAGKKAALNTLGVAIMPYAKLSDQKSSGTPGGDFNSGAWRTRTLTEQIDTSGIVSVNSNQFILQAGTYRTRGSAPAFRVNNHQARIQNITDGTTVDLGTSEFSDGGAGGSGNRSFIETEFTIASAKTFELQHYAQTTRATEGLGDPCGFGVNEVYSVLEIWKVA